MLRTAVLLFFGAIFRVCCASLVTYPIPNGIDRSTSFDVKVRQDHGPWHTLDLYQIGLHEINLTTGAAIVKKSSLAHFDFTGDVEVSVKTKSRTSGPAWIRPISYEIPLTGDKRKGVNFKLSSPMNLVVQFGDEVFNCLHLLASEVDQDIPTASDENVMFYGPGVHGSTDDIVEVPSGKTVYLSGGAVLKSGLSLANVTGSSIRGRGMVYKPSNGLQLAYANGVMVNGIILINSNLGVGQSKNVHVTNVKSFSATQWGDGMDFYCSENVLVEGVFMRNSDDCIAIYNHRDSWYGDSKNITIRHSSLWADVAHPVNIGTHGNTENPETISDVTMTNIDILDHREGQVEYQGCFSINPGDSNLIEDFVFEDIRAENFRLGQLFNLKVMFNEKYNTSPGRGIRRVNISNLSYVGDHASTAIIAGYDEERTISNVTFEGLMINGKAIYDSMMKPGWYQTSDFIPAYVNEHVRNLTYRA